jgi:hypothetical protein
MYCIWDVGQTELQTAEKRLADPSALEAETAIRIWKGMNHQALIML